MSEFFSISWIDENYSLLELALEPSLFFEFSGWIIERSRICYLEPAAEVEVSCESWSMSFFWRRCAPGYIKSESFTTATQKNQIARTIASKGTFSPSPGPKSLLSPAWKILYSRRIIPKVDAAEWAGKFLAIEVEHFRSFHKQVGEFGCSFLQYGKADKWYAYRCSRNLL